MQEIELENDCEEQGFSRLSDGCLKWECQTWGIGATKPTHPQLVERDGYWVCPKCGASYGSVEL